ncbi:MAG: 3-hydroxyacyl-CoA dehydrogenase/enoyl-CoA hydratase family protein [Calditrichia bacterium]
MSQPIQKVAVLGAGIMGGQIAAHLANAGIPSLLFDISQEAAEKGKAALPRIKPAPLYSPKYIEKIEPCNYDEHLERLGEADWIIEVVVERLDIKKQLFQKIYPHLKKEAVISSNTSGLSLQEMIAEMPEDFRGRFLITHFFNPPRYMHLLEIVSGPDTRPEVVKKIVEVGENILGKGIVYAKDTPNFVANRIGVFSVMLALELTRKYHLTVEEVDKLTGPIIGHPKSATYRTADLVGLDTLAHVSQTAFEKCENDERREMFAIPDILNKMLKNNQLGVKTGQGFYKKEGKDILSLNFETLQYQPQKKVRFDGLRIAKKQWTTAGKIRKLLESDDVAGKFTWELLSQTLIYAANRIPEIADDIVNIDNAMKWGFGWELGPFETWDAIGLEKSVKRMKAENKPVPSAIEAMLKKGYTTFYRLEAGKQLYYDLTAGEYREVQRNPKALHLPQLKSEGTVISKNWNASLVDLGDQVALLEFHSIVQPQYHPLDGAIIDMLNEALDTLPEKGFKALVIGHQGQHFSAGANLALILKYSQERDWEKLNELSKTFQDTTQRIRFSPIPVVAAPFGMCLGGGYEIIGACHRRVASAELYCGLVEFGVGVIPGAGGNLRLLLNNQDALQRAQTGPFPIVQKTFETIGFAKVSTSAKEAVFLGYLTKSDRIVLNPEHLIYEAKQEAIALAKNYQPPEYRKDIYLPGEGGRLAIELTLENLVKAGQISQHDAKIGKKLAYVLTGGEKAGLTTPVDEQYLLDIEREAFVSLCGEPLTQARMAHMLKTGKPLRN